MRRHHGGRFRSRSRHARNADRPKSRIRYTVLFEKRSISGRPTKLVSGQVSGALRVSDDERQRVARVRRVLAAGSTLLRKAGQLDQAVYLAQERTRDAFAELVSNQGVPAFMADEATRELWAFLPGEEDEPDLPDERNPLKVPSGPRDR